MEELRQVEKDLLIEAVEEYEKNHYESEGEDWQKDVNSLINKLKA